MDEKLWRVAFEPGHFASKALGVANGMLRRARDLSRIASFDLVYCFMYVTPCRLIAAGADGETLR